MAEGQMPESQRGQQGQAAKGGGGGKRSSAAIQRRKHKARARSKVKKLRAEGATVPRALQLAVRPAKRGTPRCDKPNGFAAKLLAAGQGIEDNADAHGTDAAGTSAAATGSAATARCPDNETRTTSEWCRCGVLVRFINRRIGEVITEPDSDFEVKLRWLDDRQESRFVPIDQLEYVAADVEEYVDDGEGPVRKPHKKAARKATREATAASAVAARSARVKVGATEDLATLVLSGATATAVPASAALGTATATTYKAEVTEAEEQRTQARNRKKRKKEKRKPSLKG